MNLVKKMIFFVGILLQYFRLSTTYRALFLRNAIKVTKREGGMQVMQVAKLGLCSAFFYPDFPSP